MSSSDSRQSGRYIFMDVLRVISFLIIILYHFGKELVIRGIADITDPDILMSFGRVHLVMAAVGMFFLISGAGLGIKYGKSSASPAATGSAGTSHAAAAGAQTHHCSHIWTAQSLRSYYLGRFRQILIPFYIVYIIYAIVRLALTRGNMFHDVPAWRIVFTLFGMDEYISMTGTRTFSLGIGEWFLGALVLMYLVFPLIYTCMKKYPIPSMVIGLIYYIAVVLTYEQLRALLPGTIGSHYASVPWYMDIFIKICEFSLGVFVGIYMDRIAGYPWLIAVGLMIFLPVHPSFANTALIFAIFLIGLEAEVRFIRVRMQQTQAQHGNAADSEIVAESEDTYPSCQPAGISETSDSHASDDAPCRPSLCCAFTAVISRIAGISYYVYLVHHIIIYAFGDLLAGRIVLGRKLVVLLFVAEIALMTVCAALLRRVSRRVSSKLS